MSARGLSGRTMSEAIGRALKGGPKLRRGAGVPIAPVEGVARAAPVLPRVPAAAAVGRTLPTGGVGGSGPSAPKRKASGSGAGEGGASKKRATEVGGSRFAGAPSGGGQEVERAPTPTIDLEVKVEPEQPLVRRRPGKAPIGEGSGAGEGAQGEAGG